jgi:hypothetical protein
MIARRISMAERIYDQSIDMLRAKHITNCIEHKCPMSLNSYFSSHSTWQDKLNRARAMTTAVHVCPARLIVQKDYA